MSISQDVEEANGRFKDYIAQLRSLFQSKEITLWNFPWKVRHAIYDDIVFKDKLNSIWSQIAKAEGGKLTLTTIGAIGGLALGGFGLAAMGGAIGAPLAAVLAPLGLVIGNELDSSGVTKRFLSWRFWRRLETANVNPESSMPADLPLESELLAYRGLIEYIGAEITDVHDRLEVIERTISDTTARLCLVEANFETISATKDAELQRMSSDVAATRAVARWCCGLAVVSVIVSILAILMIARRP